MNIVLYGSGEFTPLVNEIDKYLIEKYKLKTVAVIPTAAGQESDVDKWIAMAKTHFANLNIKVIPVPVHNKTQANDLALVNLVKDADWIFYSGGSPNYLLETMDGSKLWEAVLVRLNNGALLSGSSAGAMIMGKYVLAPSFRALVSPSKNIWHKAFGLVEYTIIPHFDHFKRQPGLINKLLDRSLTKAGSSLMGIDENTAIILDSNEPVVLGLGGVEIHDKTGVRCIVPK
ncbi:MAG TPA: Type 1 glutamine amidotransferase-like domain-containing protein [Candidatus Saccharimonadales bacterium]|nr:Type 1 glutamine amidotransferase-like domain-containing protein [Candidatus Saccharimonadales bacterium]